MPWVHFSEKPIEDAIKDLRYFKQHNNIMPYSLILNDSDEFLEFMESKKKNSMISEMVEDAKYIYKISIKKDANILKISTLKQVDEFMEKYEQYEIHGTLIKWKKVSEDYDGVIFNNVKKIQESIDNLIFDNNEINDDVFNKYSWYSTLVFSRAYIFNPSETISKYELVEKL
jgi:hypothetical protein